jgi:prepilin-type N-terminal cleavage/methylation domain-containing protein
MRVVVRGFTLLEICVVVAIIALLSTLAATSMISAQRAGRISGEARRTLGKIQLARSLAVSTGYCHGVLIGGHGETQWGGKYTDRIVLFKSAAAPGTPCVDFNDATDKILSNDLTGSSGDVGDVIRASHYTWDVLEAAPTQDYAIVFDGDSGRPTTFQGGTGVPLPAPVPPGTYDVMLRDIVSDVALGSPLNNPSRRRIQVKITGMATIAICPSGTNTLPCAP